MLKKLFGLIREAPQSDEAAKILQAADKARDDRDWGAAAEGYAKYLALKPNDYDIHVQHGHSLKEGRRLDDAHSAYARALALRDRDPDLLLNVGHLRKLRGDITGAIEFYQQSFAIDGNVNASNELLAIGSTTRPMIAFDQHVGILQPDSSASQYRPTLDTRIPAPNIVTSDTTLSVVIPTFNRSTMLRKTVERLSEAIGSSTSIELVVVNDGSTDDTADVLDVLQKQGLRLRSVTVPNGGPGQARNVGVSLAEGNIVMFLGDDTRPRSRDFFESHLAAHAAFPQVNRAVLGKVVWPSDTMYTNFVMQQIQGDGQQQFGFKHMTPWQWYDWPLFYTSNVSVKKSIVSDWERDGFSSEFYAAAFEDPEFAYRMTKRHGDFKVFYVPNAVVDHYHSYSVEGFMSRQVSAGMMMDVFVRAHPELEERLLGRALFDALRSSPSPSFPLEHYVSAIEGIKSWALIIDNHYHLGSQNWHGDFINAVFQLCMYHGYLIGRAGAGDNYSTAYRWLLEDFRHRLQRAIATEALGNVPGFGLV